MWQYQKNLQYPINIKNANPRLASYIVSQYGGPDGELGASLRYLSQRFSMPDGMTKGLLTDIGTEVSKWRFWFSGKMDKRKFLVLQGGESDKPMPKGGRIYDVRVVMNIM